MVRFLLILTLVSPAFVSPLRGDEATRRDGSTVVGKLTWDTGAFRFVTDAGEEPIGFLERVRPTGPPGPAPSRDVGWMLRLVGGDILPVWPLELTAKELRVRTPWADELRIPRGAVESLGQWPGRQVAGLAGETGSLALPTPDLARGWVAVRSVLAQTPGKRLTLELGFLREGKPAPVSVDLCAPEVPLRVNAPEPADVAGKLNRDGQSHLVSVAFDSESLRVVVDGYVLWARDHGPGTLREVRLATTGDGPGQPRVTSLIVWRAAPPARTPPPIDARRDRVISVEAGEIYGSLSRFDAGGPVLDLREKPVALPWGRVAECAFGGWPAPDEPSTGEHVELTGRVAGQPESRLTGRVRSWGDKTVELDHPRLGRLTLDTGWVSAVRPLFYGRRQPVISSVHHLGAREVAGFRVPAPGGELVRQFTELEEALPAAELVVDARTTAGPTALRVLIDGEKQGLIRVEGADAALRRLRLPPNARKGRVEWEIRREAEPKPGEVELRAAWLEIPLPRPARLTPEKGK